MSIVSYGHASNPDPALSRGKIKNLASLTAGAAAGSAVALGVSGAALKIGLLATAAAVSLAAFSPAAISAAGSLVALDAATGFPVTKALFITAAFAATHWVAKNTISVVQAAADAAQTSKALIKKTATAFGDMIRRPLTPAGSVPLSRYALT